MAQFLGSACPGVPQDGNSRGMKRGSERTIPGGDADLTCRSAARIRPHMAASRLAGTIFEEQEYEVVVKKMVLMTIRLVLSTNHKKFVLLLVTQAVTVKL